MASIEIHLCEGCRHKAPLSYVRHLDQYLCEICEELAFDAEADEAEADEEAEIEFEVRP